MISLPPGSRVTLLLSRSGLVVSYTHEQVASHGLVDDTARQKEGK